MLALMTGLAWEGTSFSGEIFPTKKRAKEWLKGNGYKWTEEDQVYISADGAHNIVADLEECELIV